MNILLAEDDRITRASLLRQLRAWDHHVTEAEDGQAAWEAFQAADFDMVITDWEMPRVDGVELIERIRRAELPDYVYLIILTGRSDKSDVVRGIEAGADDFVSKPFDREELRVRLLAGERVVRLERTLRRQHVQLQQAHERIRRDLDAAARVQRAMLPAACVITPRVRTAWAYHPTDELAGDALGLHLIDDRYLVSYVVDVTGHGVPAALLSVTAMHYLEPVPEATSLLRDVGRSGGLGSVRRPAEVLAELNRCFSADNSDSRFLTVVLCVLDTADGRLFVTTAGHPLPLVFRGKTAVPVPATGGPPVAVLPDARYRQATVQLAPGDRVFMFSDGLIEQTKPDDDEPFGLDRLAAALNEDTSRVLAQAVAGTVGALSQWAGGRQFADDVSVVAIQWAGPG